MKVLFHTAMVFLTGGLWLVGLIVRKLIQH